MKAKSWYVLFGITVAIVAGLVSSYGFTSTTTILSSPSQSSVMMVGHITLTAYDPNGNILAYRQTDNLIVDQGENCALAKMFGNNTGSGATQCNANTGFFQIIAVGNGTSSVTPSDTSLSSEHPKTGNPSFGLDRSGADTITVTSANGTTTAKAILTKQFTNNATSQISVSESGIFNSTNQSSDAMFARQQFTAIPLNKGESLTVQWTINIGGTATPP